MTRSLPVVRLRAIEPEDLDMLYGIENDTKLWNVSVTSVPYSRYTLYDYIANSKNDIYSDRQVRMMVENGGGEVVGIVDLINFDPKHLRAEIGIVIKREYRNQGYAQAAIGEICDYALNVLHLHPDGKYGSYHLFHDKPSSLQKLPDHNASKLLPCEYSMFLLNKVPVHPTFRRDNNNGRCNLSSYSQMTD